MSTDLLDGWRWPGGDSPASLHTASAGQSVIRHPAPDSHRVAILVPRLRQAAEQLRPLGIHKITALLVHACQRFLHDLDGQAVRQAAANAGLSEAMMTQILGGLAAGWSDAALRRLVAADFPDPVVLDHFVDDGERRVHAAAPACTAILGSGTVPGVTITAMIRSLLVGSAVLAKPGSGDVALTMRFARAAAATDARLGEAVAVQYWPGGEPEWEEWEATLFRAADQVVIYGSDATIESVRARTPATTRLVEHPGRVGVAVVDPAAAPAAVTGVARAATLFEQRGCVSTHLVLLLVGDGASASPRASTQPCAIVTAWCEELARCMRTLESRVPPQIRDPGQMSRIHQLRGSVGLRKAARGSHPDLHPDLWYDPQSGWTVILDGSDRFEPCGGRTIQVAPVADLDACLDALRPLRLALQTVGLAGLATDRPGRNDFMESLAALGATRIVPIARVPFPEADWLHDGHRPLGELVRWCELRGSAEE